MRASVALRAVVPSLICFGSLVSCSLSRAPHPLEAQPPPPLVSAWAELPPPACRLAGELPPVVFEMANAAFRSISRGRELGWDGVSINDVAPAKLPLFVVTDAAATSVDESGCPRAPLPELTEDGQADRLTVRGICEAGINSIRCSSGALRALVEVSSSADKSAVLFFVLAHELAHIALRTPGAHAEHVETIPRDRTARQKQAQLERACYRDRAMLEQELAADKVALGAVVDAFTREPFASAGDDSRSALARNGDRLYREMQRLEAWRALTPGAGRSHSGTGFFVCEIMSDGAATELPFYGGGHPRHWSRLSTVVDAIVEAVSWDETGKEHPERIPTLGTNQITDFVVATASEDAVKRFCDDVHAYAAGRLDCTGFQPSTVIHVPDERLHDGPPEQFESLQVAAPEPRKSDRPASFDDGFATYISVRGHTRYRERSAGVAGQKKMAQAADDYLRQLAQRLVGLSGAWVFHEHTPVELTSFRGNYSATFTGQLIVWTPQRPTTHELPSGGEELQVDFDSRDARAKELVLVLRVDAAERSDEKEEAVRLLTKALSLGELFDERCAPAGSVNCPASSLREWFGFVLARLQASTGRPHSLASQERSGWRSYLNTQARISASQFKIPSGWLTGVVNAPAEADSEQFAARIDRAFDSAHREGYSMRQLASVFGEGAGPGSGTENLTRLGLDFKEAKGGPELDAKAVDLFRRACDRNDQAACAHLGGMYVLGRGVPRNVARGIDLLESACEKGALIGCARRGLVYAETPSNAEGDARAVQLLTRACRGGELVGCFGLGSFHLLGRGVDRDGFLALAYLQRACEGDIPSACLMLSNLYVMELENGPRMNGERAAEYSMMACEKKLPEGCTTLGDLFASGILQPRSVWGDPDLMKAASWYERGCEAGDAKGCLLAARALIKIGHLPSDAKIRGLVEKGCAAADVDADPDLCNRLRSGAHDPR